MGARRLEPRRDLSGDPLVTRFCGVARWPTRRTVADWLRQFTQETLAPLVALNRDLVTEALARLGRPRLPIDVDGSVIRTGATGGWAFRGVTPHHRKDPSDYPWLAPVAQPGHILRLKNRPGHVPASKQAVPFRRELSDDLRRQVGRRVVLEFRMDAAVFQRGILQLLPARACGYAIQVGEWSGRPRKPIAAAGRRGPPVAPGVTGHEAELGVTQWHDLRRRVVLSRKHVAHATRKNFQLDLFTPDDGHSEYSAVATNLPLGLAALWAFACGRGAQEKTFAALTGEFALDVVPTKHDAANSAWHQLSILAHNLIRNFQLETLAEPKPRSRKRTSTYLFRSLRTLRFLLIARAGRLSRLGGRTVLRLTNNPATESLYEQIAHRLAA